MKAALRERMTALRRAVPAAIRARAAQEVCDQVLALDLEGPVMLYVSVRDELGTRALIDAIPRVAIPRVVGKELECRELTNWVDGVLRIPTTDGPQVSPRAVLLPGLAFDRSGGRLGYGGGYYDRFLARHPAARRIALGYDFQVIDEVPMEAHDLRVERVLTGTTR